MRPAALALIALGASIACPALAAEGLWSPGTLSDAQHAELSAAGLTLTPDDLAVGPNTLTAAVVRFDTYCTGSFVSPRGLLLISQHCAIDALTKLSGSVDYTAEGFWAKSDEDELKVPELKVSVLMHSDDVSDRVFKHFAAAAPDDREMVLAEAIAEIEAEQEAKGLRAKVSPQFGGLVYRLDAYKDYDDVRLVGSPAADATSSPDERKNKGNIAFFRVYSDGKPLVPGRHLSVSAQPRDEGDLAVIYGFPGHTDRYATVAQFRADTRVQGPRHRQLLGDVLPILTKWNLPNARATARYDFGLERQAALVADGTLEASLQARETALHAWSRQDPKRRDTYGSVLPSQASLIQDFAATAEAIDVLNLAGLQPAAIVHALRWNRLLRVMERYDDDPEEWEEAVKTVRTAVKVHHETFDPAVDRAIFEATLPRLVTLPQAARPDFFDSKTWTKKTKGSTEERAVQLADRIYGKSVLTSQSRALAFLDKPSLNKLNADPGVQLGMAVLRVFRTEVFGTQQRHITQLEDLDELLWRMRFEQNPEHDFYADADSTLRMSWGQISSLGSQPAVAQASSWTSWPPSPSAYTAKLKERLDAGQPVGLLSDTETAGGGAGSPVLNAQAHLIGVASGRHPDAMDADWVYDESRTRTMAVDSRFVLFLLDEVAQADRLIEEMTVVTAE